MALLMRPEPFSEFNRLVNTLLASPESGAQRYAPAVDLVESEGHFLLRADLPGMSDGDVSVEVNDNTLTISGERKAQREQNERGWYRIERSFGRFSRSLTLPEGVDPEKIEAHFDKGVLEVQIPKPEQRQPRRVAIQSHDAQSEPAALDGTATDRQAAPAEVGAGDGQQ